jgi:hypothetical protein
MIHATSLKALKLPWPHLILDLGNAGEELALPIIGSAIAALGVEVGWASFLDSYLKEAAKSVPGSHRSYI